MVSFYHSNLLSSELNDYNGIDTVTDDVSIKDKDPATLTFVPTRYTGIDRLKSRRGIKCLQVSETHSTAGIRLDKKGLRIEDEDSFTLYKTFELSFENEQGVKEPLFARFRPPSSSDSLIYPCF